MTDVENFLFPSLFTIHEFDFPGEKINLFLCLLLQDSRFTNMVDQKTGYTTHNMLCNPIFDIQGEVMGVAQVINKKAGNTNGPFTENDEQVFAQYLQFCGIGLRNVSNMYSCIKLSKWKHRFHLLEKHIPRSANSMS